MAILNEYGNEMKCDRCGTRMLFSDVNSDECIDIIGNHGGEIMDFIKHEVFSKKNGYFGARPKEVYGDYCKECATTLYPWFCRVLDILILRQFVNKLEKKINEQKRSNRA
jgi:hypothetical protein